MALGGTRRTGEAHRPDRVPPPLPLPRQLPRFVHVLARSRPLLILLAIALQLLMLGVLLAVLWVVRVRDLVEAPAAVVAYGSGKALRCRVRGPDVAKVAAGAAAEVEFLDDTGGHLAGRGLIAAVTPVAGGAEVDLTGPGLARIAAEVPRAPAPRVRLAVRTRRALSIMLDSSRERRRLPLRTGGRR